MLHRLSWKLIFSLTLIVLVVSSLYGVYHVSTQKRRLLDTMVLGADQLSRSITSATWHAMLADHRSAAYDIMRVIGEKQGIDRIRMYNREGRLMFSSRAEDDPQMRADLRSDICRTCHTDGVRQDTLSVRSRVRITQNPNGGQTLNMVTPIYNEPACSQAACHAHPPSVTVLGVLDLGLGLDPVNQEVRNIRMQVAVLTVAEVVISGLFIILFVRRFVSRPIEELIEGTKIVSAMELDRPIRIRHRSQELDELVSSFNLMREQLKNAVGEINEFTQRLETKVTERTTQLKAAHQRLLQTDRLASLGQLAASVAHEINNPIGGILNLSVLIQRIIAKGGIPPGREDEVRKYLGQVIGETTRVGRIVSDLLAFSRRSRPQRAEADLNKLVESTVSLVTHKLKLSDTQASLELQPDLPHVLCDASQIRQVVMNLVLNGAEATQSKGSGRVTVRTRLAADRAAVQLEVEDNGEGITPENLPKIFDPFFTTKAEGKGVGLGLAVLYGIVKAHDGEVDVASMPGKGTRFVITLPLASVNEALAPEQEMQTGVRQ